MKMKREDRKKILSYAEYVSLGSATLLVVFYQIFGLSILVMLALALYVVAFSMMTLYEIENFMFISNRKIDEEDEAKRLELEKIKKSEKNVALTKAILSGVMAVFTIVVLILF